MPFHPLSLWLAHFRLSQNRLPIAEFLEQFELFEPWQFAQTTALGLLCLHYSLHVSIHGCRKRFSNLAQVSSSECRVRISMSLSRFAPLASINITNLA